MPTISATYTFDARFMVRTTTSFTLDAEIALRRFTLDGFITGNPVRHDRTIDHTGVEDATTVSLSAPIGLYPAGMTVQAFLDALTARVTALETGNHVVRSFLFDAVLSRLLFTLNAVKRVPVAAGFYNINAVLTLTVRRSGSFTLDASFRPAFGAITLDAYLV